MIEINIYIRKKILLVLNTVIQVMIQLTKLRVQVYTLQKNKPSGESTFDNTNTFFQASRGLTLNDNRDDFLNNTLVQFTF